MNATDIDLTDALAAVRVILGNEDVPADAIPADALIGLRRDVEYYATMGHMNGRALDRDGNGDYRPVVHWDNYRHRRGDPNPFVDSRNYAAPRNVEGVEWGRTSETDSDPMGEWEPLESEWVGSDVMVYPFRWDAIVKGLEGLALGLQSLDLDPDSMEPIAGMLDADPVDGVPRMFPCGQRVGDGMDWNVGGLTPVFIYADYITLY